jgi:predicted TPR repeat methyltransferase
VAALTGFVLQWRFPAITSPADAMTESRRVTVQEAVAIARERHRNGRQDEALRLYTQILEAVPGQPDALHYLGLLRYQQGRVDEAIDLIRRAVDAAPDYADAYSNLGNILGSAGRLPEAVETLRKAVALNPRHAHACNNLGSVLRRSNRPLEAEQSYLRALELDPDHAGARRNLANLLRRSGRLPEAAVHYRRLLERQPDDPILGYNLAICEPGPPPSRAPDDFVRAMFDDMADDFDHKLAGLSYRAPGLVEALLERELDPRRDRLDILDAGCGTGLCGRFLRPRAARLVGVDLSPRMLDKARSRGLYDALVAAELTDWLQRNPGCCELLVCADTLCYFGDLVLVLQGAAGALRPGGLMVFTTEQRDGEDGEEPFEHKPSGRFGHGTRDIGRALTRAGLRPRVMEKVAELRREGGRPVAGILVLAEKGSGNADM